MPDYGQKKDKLIISTTGLASNSSKAGVFLYRSGSLRDHTTAISASVPQIIAVTCSGNTDNVLTKLASTNAYAIITITSGSSIRQKDTRLILRYTSASFKVFSSGSRISPSSSNVIEKTSLTSKNLLYSSSEFKNDFYINIPIKNNDDSFAVAYKTVDALNKAGNGTNYTASLIDDGSGLLNVSSSLGENMKIGTTFKVRNSSSFSASIDITGKFTLTSLNSGSVADPDFSGTKVHVGGMKVGSTFKVGNTNNLFNYNIIQAGSGRKNQPFYEGKVIEHSRSLGIEIDPDDKQSSFITGSGDTKIYFSGSGYIGVNTKNPKRVFDIEDSTTGVAEIALKKSRKGEGTKHWRPDDEIGLIRFIAVSESFSTASADPESSGSVFDIQTVVGVASPSGLTGVYKLRGYKGGGSPETFYEVNAATGDHTFTGDVNVVGTLSSTKFHSSTVSSSIVYSSGSNIFGDAATDTHTFVGHITASGNISASGDLYASGVTVPDSARIWSGPAFFSGTAIGHEFSANVNAASLGGGKLVLSGGAGGHISASGNISSSGAVSTFGEIVKLVGEDPRLALYADAGDHPGYELYDGTTRKWIIYNDPDDSHNLNIKDDGDDRVSITQSGRVGIGKTNPTKTLEVAGDISSSGTIFSSILSGGATGDQSGSLYLSGSLTFRNNEAYPAVSASTLYNSGSDLYFGSPVGSTFQKIPIAPKQIKIYHHNFMDDLGTSKVYVPWYDQTEGTIGYGMTGALMPFNCKLRKVFLRLGSATGTANITVSLNSVNAASTTATAIGTKVIGVDTNSDNDHLLVDFTGTLDSGVNTVAAGKVVSIGLQASSDVTSHNYIMVTSVWELDLATELNASITS